MSECNWEEEFDKHFERELESDHEYYTSQLKLVKNFFRQKEKEIRQKGYEDGSKARIDFKREELNLLLNNKNEK